MATLDDSSRALLTLVALSGPRTAYQLKNQVARLAGEYWSVPHTQVYRQCDRLADAGLLTASQEPGGRRRRVYDLTPAGREEVERWVREPTAATMQIRDVAQFKLLAAELSTPEALRELAELQVADYRRRLALLDQVEERFGDRPGLRLRLRNVRMGRAVYRAALEFWSEVARDPLMEQDPGADRGRPPRAAGRDLPPEAR